MDTATLQNSIPAGLTSSPVITAAKWEQSEGGGLTYRIVSALYLGRIKVAYFYMDVFSKKTVVKSGIPGIKQDLGEYRTEEEAAKKCYSVAAAVLRMLGEIDK